LNRRDLIDKYNLMVSALFIMPWDLFGITKKNGYLESQLRSRENVSKFIELHENLIDIRARLSEPYSKKVYEYAKSLQRLYGDFELTNKILAEVQIIIDLIDYTSSWDNSFKYPDKNSPLLRDCPRLLDYLDERYNI
jgi:hypothetical protein